ncbi:MAG TPA: helix-turn-helix domain-containing protein [Blastocatellia bacterium]|nr:helix-turn-helix domain-containing protein [Blastocatellia bacterium]
MRYPKEHKAKIRRQILDSAARLFRTHGYEGVGVDAIMAETGLTAGGFYAHFPSKEALFAEAVALTLEQSAARRRLRGRSVGATRRQSQANPLAKLIDGYLSRAHRDGVADGCPLPALTPDVARSGPATREGYERELRQLLAELETWLPDGSTPQRDRAWALIAECVGGLMLSRAVNDEQLSDQILRACRQAAAKICEP